MFKDAEKKAMQVREKARADAQQRRRISKTGQFEIFKSQEMHDSSYHNRLIEQGVKTRRADPGCASCFALRYAEMVPELYAT
ncbi:MAG: hypothetical protein HYY13_00065 [Nitrospirae bacterium]|nr:hypothetical protein [Nitrospirota bacterium]